MTTYILDSSAVLRYVDREAGGERVREILKACVAGRAEVCVSAVQWGEVAGNLRRRFGAADEVRILGSMFPSEVAIVTASGERAVRAAELKVDRKLGYADAFAVELAMSGPERVLVTADYGFKVAGDLARIEFLALK